MAALQNKTALVIGASSGVGRATVKSLLDEGACVVAVARGVEALAASAAQSDRPIRTVAADAADPATAERLMREFKPHLVVLAAGVRPHMAPVDEQTWETFSLAWLGDTQAAFHLVKAALTLPLAPGATVAIVSSGAAIAGSPLSGGYSGAKRMQWLLTEYAQDVSDAK